MDDEALLAVLSEASQAVRSALTEVDDLRRPGRRPGQYALDLVADAAALPVLHGAGLAVLSEESGTTQPPDGAAHDLLVVLDPVDGSTNAAHGIPWFATSLCVLDGEGPRVALVENQASGERFEAIRGGGAWRDGRAVGPSACSRLEDAVVGVSGLPGPGPGWAQFRALGSAALDHCAVAAGALDAYLAVGGSSLRGWDYLGGLLVCTEAGAATGELDGAELVVRDDGPRRPVAAATPELLQQLLCQKAG
ncbi:MAG: inositol monophosphatase family protein [Acidimicrobiales bacterium]